MRDEVMDVVRASFRPEFLNRVDDIIVFHRLRRQDMGEIVDIQLKRLEKLLEEREIALDLDQDAIDWLAAKGYDPAYGARPLKRVHPARAAGPAGREDPARRHPRRLAGEDHRRLRPAQLPRQARRGRYRRGCVSLNP